MRISNKQTLVLGPPGCGKTTYLITEVEKLLDKGVATDNIAFVSFTRKAVTEARTRACAKFGIQHNDLPYFKTIHSMCFSRLNCRKEDLMTSDNYDEFGAWIGHTFKGIQDDMDAPLGMQGTDEGDKLLFYDNLARTMLITPKQLWEDGLLPLEYTTLQRFCVGYKKFKEHYSLLDFTDLLEKPLQPLSVEYVFVDEAQDLSKLQWRVLKSLFHKATVVIAGDDDQSIYKWSGADLQSFLELEGEQIVLSKSYRLPKAVYNHAQTIIKNVSNRFTKQYAPTSEEGSVQVVGSLDHIEKPTCSTLILARNTYLLPQAYEWLKRNGTAYTGRSGVNSIKPSHAIAIHTFNRLLKGEIVPATECELVYDHIKNAKYIPKGAKQKLKTTLENQTLESLYLPKLDWWDVLNGIPNELIEYYRTIDIENITPKVSIHVDTIHGVKGGEADTVIILSDYSKKTHEEFNLTPDNEHRVAYVAVTRAKSNVIIVGANSKYSYPYSYIERES